MLRKITINIIAHLFIISGFAQTWNIGYPNAEDVTASFSSDGNTLTVRGTGAMMNFTSKPPWGFPTSFTTLIIENGVTNIGNRAFEDCSFSSVTIPYSVISIGHGAFNGCQNLVSWDIPNTITSIGDGAFASCYKLTSVTIPNSVTSIPQNAFVSCTGLTSVIIPNSVTSIGKHAFSYCRSLTSVNIPNSVTFIDYGAFFHCDALTSVTLPNSLTLIGENAFGVCSSLASLTIPGSLPSVPRWTFQECINLASITVFNSTPPGVGGYCFEKVNKKTCIVYVPKGSKSAYETANEWSSFENIVEFGSGEETVPVTGVLLNTMEKHMGVNETYQLIATVKPGNATNKNVTWTSENPTIVTVDATGLVTAQSVGTGTITVTTVDGNKTDYTRFIVNSNIVSVTEVKLNKSSLTLQVGESESLVATVIPSNATNKGLIWSTSDAGTVSLFNEKLTAVSTGTATIKVKTQDGEYIDSCVVTVESGGDYPFEIDENGILIKYHGNDNHIVIPEKVKGIGDRAFADCSNLTSVEIPNTVTSIGAGAFGNTNLRTVYIPGSVTDIGNMVFSQSRNLISIEVDPNNSYYKSIDGVLYNKSATTLLECPNRKAGDLIIPNTVVSIVKSAFDGGNEVLTSISIPASVNQIGQWTFANLWGLVSIHVDAANASYSSENGVLYDKSKKTLLLYPQKKNDSSFTIPSTVERIPEIAMSNNTYITTLTIPASVKTIEWNAIGGTQLTTVYAQGTTPAYISQYGFTMDLSACTLYVPAGTKKEYEARDVWKDFGTIKEEESEELQKIAIQNLSPNINPLVYDIKEYATIYRYYRIADENSLPVENIIIDFKIGNKLLSSSPSDYNGYVSISVPIWGNDIDSRSDDYVHVGSQARMSFSRLRRGDSVLATPVDNAFTPVDIFVSEYEGSNKTFGFGLGAKGNLGYKFNGLKGDINATAGTKFSFTHLFENKLITGMEYKYSTTISGSYKGGTSKTPFFRVKYDNLKGGGANYRYTFKETLSPELKSYLKIGFDFLFSLSTTGQTNAELHYMVNALGTYLGIQTESSTTTENQVSLFADTKQNFGFELDDDVDHGVNLSLNVNAKAALGGSYGTSFDAVSLKEKSKSSIFANIEAGIGGDIKFNTLKENFGAGGSYNLNGGIKFSRERTVPFSTINKVDLALSRGRETNINTNWTTGGFSVTTSKSYDYKYSFKEAFIKNFPAVANSELSSFIVNNTVKKLPVGEELSGSFNALIDDITGMDDSLAEELNNSFTYTVEKNYTAKADFTKTIGKFSLLNFNGGLTVSMNIFSDGTFPVAEKTYHFKKKELLPIVEYEDINETFYYFSPFDAVEEPIDKALEAIKNTGNLIKEAASAFANQIIDFFSPDDKTGKTFVNTRRDHSTVLKNYSKLRSLPQDNFSTITFDIPGDKKCFDYRTKISFEHYYPGGEVLGTTAQKDTFIIISDIFFLNAYHDTDTLTQAPLGSFNIKGLAGKDDLSFLGINDKFPTSVYYKPNGNDYWNNIGSVNSDIKTNGLGLYALGVDLTKDNEPPLISISDKINNDIIEISIRDNMAVYWKQVAVLVNGIVTNYKQEGNKLFIELSNEQLNTDIYVTVYASDLARNEAYATKEFSSGNTNSPEIYKTTDLYKLYPNPAHSTCYLEVPENTLQKKTEYVIVSALGQIIERKSVMVSDQIIDVTNLNSGIYFVILLQEGKIISNKKLIKK